MPLFLSSRDITSEERMDDPDCNQRELENTYRQFRTVNTLISQWYRIYKREIRPFLVHDQSVTLLDIGFGGGDIPRKLSRWARRDGLNLQITAIDPDPRAFHFIQKLDRIPQVEFLQCNLSEMDPSQQQFDFVVSNHLLHHLDANEFSALLAKSKRLSKTAVIFNDIQRSDWAYFLFNLLSRPFFHGSFITEDGLISIKRSYTPEELRQAVPEEWEVQTVFPFRLLLTYHP